MALITLSLRDWWTYQTFRGSLLPFRVFFTDVRVGRFKKFLLSFHNALMLGFIGGFGLAFPHSGISLVNL